MISMIIFFSIAFTIFVSTFIVMHNYFHAPILQSSQKSLPLSSLSVLIPARDEEINLPQLLESLKNQEFMPLEIIVLDDHSTDKTLAILSEFQKRLPNLSFIKGKPLPPGWKGKNWACHQLAQQAKGEYFLFLDADVQLASQALASALQMASTQKAGLLSIFPTQKTLTFAEKLIVPLMHWILLAFLPLSLVSKSKKNYCCAANGQFMLFSRECYENIGGHEKIKHCIVEDMALAKNVKQTGYKLLTLLGGKLIFCRMYHSFSEALSGFARSFYPGFRLPAFYFIFLLFFFTLPFLLPFLLFLWYFPYLYLIIAILLSRLLISRLTSSHFAILSCLFHPLQMLLLLYLGLVSVTKSILGTLTWKNRFLK